MKVLLRNSTEHRKFIIILFIGLLSRLLIITIFPIDYRLQNDALEYITVAENMCDYGTFGTEADVPYAKFPPGYPLLICGVFTVFGKSLLMIRIIQTIISVVSIGMIFLITKKVASTKISLMSAFLFAIFPPFIGNVVLYLTETLYILIILIFWYYFIKFVQETNLRNAIFSGLAFGTTLLVKETLIVFPLLLPFIFFFKKIDLKKDIHLLFVFIISGLIVISPWIIRNYLRFNKIFFTSRTSAIQVKITDTGYLSDEFEDWSEERDSSIDQSDELYDYYLKYGRTSDLWDLSLLIKSPGIYLRYIFNRLIEFWFHPNGLESLPDIGFVQLGYRLFHCLFLLLAIYQILVNLWRGDVVSASVLCILIYITVVGVIFRRPNPRYNMPFLSLLISYTVMGGFCIMQRLKIVASNMKIKFGKYI